MIWGGARAARLGGSASLTRVTSKLREYWQGMPTPVQSISQNVSFYRFAIVKNTYVAVL